MSNYIPLDPSTVPSVGKSLSFTIGQSGSLFAIASLVLFLFLVADGLAAITMILYALGLRVGTFGEASDANIVKSKKIISGALFALLFSFGLVLFVMAINPDMVTGNVDFTALQTTGRSGIQTQSAPAAASASCPNADAYKSSLASGAGVCAGVSCQALSGCNISAYSSIIERESAKQGISPSLVEAIMCRESKGNAKASHVNNPPTNIDCGLMQINKPGTTCSDADYDVTTNIATGVSLIKQKFSSISQSYPGISKEMMVFASYNCCGTEGSPNQASADCTPASGFPFTLPRWACPINPGPTASNMCFVRNYACDANACMNQLNQ